MERSNKVMDLVNCFRLMISCNDLYFVPSYRTLADDIMMQLSMAHGLTGNIGYLKAKVGVLFYYTV